jgi:23S rRNA (pseudouridine1915-N3)-methyltransferase
MLVAAKCRAPVVRAAGWAGRRAWCRHTAAAAAAAGRPNLATAAAAGTARPAARAVRPVPLKLIYVAKPDPDADAVAGAWADKVRRYAPLAEVCVRGNPSRAADPGAAVRAEGDRVLKALGPADVVVALDERGKEASSEGIADLLADAGGAGGNGSGLPEVRAGGSLVFLIGGPFGHDARVRDRAARTLRLSGCVLNHAVARIVLLEQLYRGWTILRGEPYHH